jgi:hypothetical protein
MKRGATVLILVLACSGWLVSQDAIRFDDFFIDRTMRIDYFHGGDSKVEWITTDKIYDQGVWAGSKIHLIDRFDNGRYYIKVYDALSGKLIYSKGFDCYFAEYKTTESALKGIKRTYHETALIPYPKQKIRFTLEIRDKKNILHRLYTQDIDPAGINIIKESPDQRAKVFEVLKNGAPAAKVDVAFIAEGYRKEERELFRSDLKRFADVFLSLEPYTTHKQKFNLYGVFRPSEESGCDEPRRGVFRRTAVEASFNSLGSERYLLTEDNKSLRDIAAAVPYDALVIMVNHKRYGGGGIYNFYCVFTAHNQWSDYLLLHEFGHSFAGLADEYYTSSVAYNEFYPEGVEPTEPNITALLDPSNLKWKEFLSPGIKIPTPWEKEGYDKMDRAYQKKRRDINAKISKLMREGAAETEVEKWEKESAELSRTHRDQVEAYFARSRFKGKVGAFEGAGYASLGLYRPMLDCLMFTRGKKPFCRVCAQAVVRVIEHFSE